jgi:hypothetical protein
MSGWDEATYRRRIADPNTRRRWAGGSPDPHEIAAYADMIPAGLDNGTAMVLGMTPELRQLALGRFARVASVDRSEQAHAIYGDWIPATLAAREERLVAGWTEVAHLDGCVDVIFGDGVFGNCESATAALRLLYGIRRLLKPGGVLITRHACYPDGYRGQPWVSLVEGWQAGSLSDDEAGFALRLAGFIPEHWDAGNCLLHCGGVFSDLAGLYRDGHLSERLMEIALRYHFVGDNWIPDERRWQEVLAQGGWRHRRLALSGRHWYAYYPLYCCTPD